MFTLNNIQIIIPCKTTEKIKDIYHKLSLNLLNDNNKLNFIYNGKIIDGELTYEQIINEEDKKRNIMNILLKEIEIKDYINKEIRCPKCNENILIKINDYKINMYNCKNGHKIDNILLNEFINMQKINISKNIINNYNKKYIKPNELLDNDIMPNNNLKNDLHEFNKYIDIFKKDINEIITKLNNIINDIEIYYNICSNYSLNNHKNENLENINESLNYKNNILKDIKDIIKEDNIENKFKNLMILYNKINQNNNNFIIAEIDIKEDDINKDIKIINSFEKTKRDEGWEDEDDDYKCENEKEIKENCEIKINDKIIPFSYFYKFNKIGKYKIKYSFKNNLTKTSCLFYGCSSLTYIDLSNFKAQNVTNMVSMFRDCLILKNINLSNFNTQNVTDIGAMFYGCKSLTEINLSNFNTQNVYNMANLFNGCKSLTDINLSNFNIQKVSDMAHMFFDCKSLKKIYLSNLNLKLLLIWIECSLDIEL